MKFNINCTFYLFFPFGKFSSLFARENDKWKSEEKSEWKGKILRNMEEHAKVLIWRYYTELKVFQPLSFQWKLKFSAFLSLRFLFILISFLQEGKWSRFNYPFFLMRNQYLLPRFLIFLDLGWNLNEKKTYPYTNHSHFNDDILKPYSQILK